MFKATNLYLENYDSKQKFVVNQGGTGSGKTFALLQLLFTYAVLEPNLVITVVGQDIPNLKKGAFRDAISIYSDSSELQKWTDRINQTDRIFTFKNGSLIEFASFQDEQDAKSGKRDYLFLNEADGIPYEIFWQLAIRTRKQIYIDYNPTARFWVHDKLIGKPETRLIISDHRHNMFLPKDMHRMIESIDDTELFKVYARGVTGKLEGVIFTNWQPVEASEMPATRCRWIGLDFGYSNDPTAIIDVRFHENELWLDEICYQRRMLNSDIISILSDAKYATVPIIADSAEPKSIEELRRAGLRIEPAQKGKDSVRTGIDILKRYRMNVTKQSHNLRKELLSYSWKKSKNGDYLNEPVDFLNHALDGIRYTALNKLGSNFRSGKKPIFRLGKLY